MTIAPSTWWFWSSSGQPIQCSAMVPMPKSALSARLDTCSAAVITNGLPLVMTAAVGDSPRLSSNNSSPLGGASTSST